MSITVFSDVILPNSVILAGIKGKQIRNNTRASSLNGGMSININWSKTLRQYELGVAPMALDLWQTIEGLHEVTQGGAYGFLMSDPKDNAVAAGSGFLWPYTTVLVGTSGAGFGVPTYKLQKRYVSVGSSRFNDRGITRPKATPVLKRDAATLVVGSSAGQIALNYDTGTVTFVADATEAPTSITVGAPTILNYSSGAGMVAALSVGQRIFLSGITGSAATALNGLSHVIASKGASSLSISTSTTGLAVTAPGTSYKYPQASEALTWTGSFYVPVHFTDDFIDWELVVSGPDTQKLLAGPSVILDEVRE